MQSIQNQSLGLDNFSGIGSTAIDQVNLKNFDLVDGGQINLTGGVHTLFLNSAGENTQIHLRELPAQFLPGSTSSSSTTTTGSTSTTSSSSSSNPTSATSTTGITLQYTTNPTTQALTLTSISGSLTTNFTAIQIPKPDSPTTGVRSRAAADPAGDHPVDRWNPRRPRASSNLSDPEVYGYDPVANALILFDASTGAELQTIPLPTGSGTMTTGVALGRDNNQLVALLGNGTTIYAYNALNGSPVGKFSTANLNGFSSIDGIGSTDDSTVFASSSVPGGIAQIIDVTASLASGQAVAVGSAFTPQRQFEFSGGLTGVAGSNTIYSVGAAHFDTFQPDLNQAGILALSTAGGQLTESSRTALKNKGNFINAGPDGAAQSMPFAALGSIDQSLALVTGVSNGQNVVELLDPSSLSNQGTITLNDPNQLTGLSESFHPDLVDTALVDIQGNVQSLRSTNARGLFFNEIGYANLVKFHNVTDSTFVALPFGHAEIPNRSDVTILSTTRPVNGRNGVTIEANLKPVGPLSLPTPGPPT